jgi:hypothetical protein
MKTIVIINLDIEGFHYYKEAPKQVEFLRNNHRHIFNIKIGYKVDDLNREKEIFIQTALIQDYLNETYGVPCHFEQMSCEMIAKELLEFASCDNAVWCEVLEDNKGGAKVEL